MHVTRETEMSQEAAEKKPDRAPQAVIVIPLEIDTVKDSVCYMRIVDEIAKVITPCAPVKGPTEQKLVRAATIENPEVAVEPDTVDDVIYPRLQKRVVAVSVSKY